MGVTAAMEEERANGAPIDDGAINGVKVGLMGPLAGVGDPIYWGTARIILAALGASLAITGNIMGPLIFFIGINIIRILTRWYSMKYGYEKGTEIVQDMEGGQLQKTDHRRFRARSLCHGRPGRTLGKPEHPAGNRPLHQPKRRRSRHHRAIGTERPAARPRAALAHLPLHDPAEEKK